MNFLRILATGVMLALSVIVGIGIYHIGEISGMTHAYALLGALLLGGESVLFIYRPSEMGVSTMVYKKKTVEPEVPAAPAQVATPQPKSAAASPSREQMHYYSMGYQQGLQDGAQQGYNAASGKVLSALGIKLVEKNEASAEEVTEEGGENPSFPPPLPELAEQRAPAHACARCGHTIDDHQPLAAKACFTKGCKCDGYTEKKSILQKIFNR